MTSSAKFSAHCSNEKELVVVVGSATAGTLEKYVLNNGETKEVYLYDDYAVLSYEQVKVVNE
jgi:hypothetical protein